jgi:chitin disaccharide deacetylase
MSKRLVVNADDLGLAESVNRGIADTIELGVVTSTSLIVNLAACDDAIRRLRYLRALGRNISVGLHFNIVTGHPLSRATSLVDSRTGQFLPLSSIAMRAVARMLNLDDVQRELDAQLQLARSLLSRLNMRVTHIDSHRHTHCLPGILELVQRTAKENGIGHVRHPREQRYFTTRPRAAMASSLLRAMLYRSNPTDDVVFTGIGAMDSASFHRDIASLIAGLPSGTTELMVHPGYDSDELAAVDYYRAPREREVYALTSPRLRQTIEALGVELTHFGTAVPESTARTA